MPVTTEYFKEAHFIKTEFTGKFTDKELLAHVRDLNEITKGMESVVELADCRGVTDISRLSADGVEFCSSWESNKPGSRLVILIPQDNITFNVLGGIYEATCEENRAEVVVLNDLDDAIRWLSCDFSRTSKIKALFGKY